MPSSPKIPKDKILEAALQMLIRDGYASLNIKSLAKELNCSTQPVSWHFGNMDGLRRELADFALSYANKKMQPHAENAFEAFTEIGHAYVNIAFEEPNLFRFLFLDRSSGYCVGGMEAVCGLAENKNFIKSISELFGISIPNAAEYVGNSTIYSHGILALVVSGVLKSDKSQVLQMIDQAGYAFLMKAGGNIDYAMELNNRLKKELCKVRKTQHRNEGKNETEKKPV